MPTLRERLEADLKTAMRERDRTRVSILRTTMSALSNAEAVDSSASRPQRGVYASEVARRELTDDEILAVLERERAELLASVGEYEAGGQHDAAAELRTKAAVLDGYLGGVDSPLS